MNQPLTMTRFLRGHRESVMAAFEGQGEEVATAHVDRARAAELMVSLRAFAPTQLIAAASST